MGRNYDRVKVIDTHTGGEPTRVVIGGGPDLHRATLSQQRRQFDTEFDAFRSAVVCEPRGSDVLVGALLAHPQKSQAATGVIFFNNIGTLGMCGHGTIGVAVAMSHAGMLEPGSHIFETPVGDVDVRLHDDLEHVTIENVVSYRWKANVDVNVPGFGKVRGDVAWGGNWFFLVREHALNVCAANIADLTAFTLTVRRELAQSGVTGKDGAEIDHVELFGESDTEADSRNFVLCPGGAYDRSPCGTGTSAKVACLAADGLLQPGEVWHQESIIGSRFQATYRRDGDSIIPLITGSAWVTAEADLLLDPMDPFLHGIRI